MKICSRNFFVILCSLFVLLAGCSSLPKDNEQLWQYNSDKTLGVLVQTDGLHFTKKVSASYKNIIVHVEKADSKTSTTDNSPVDLVWNTSSAEVVYPFTKKGQSYKVNLSYQNKQSGKITKSPAITVTATGGLGEYCINAQTTSASYDSRNWKLNFSSYNLKQSVKPNSQVITGSIITKKNQTFWYNDFKIEDKALSLKPVLGKIRGQTFSLVLDYFFEYDGQVYTQEFYNNSSSPFTDTNEPGEIGNTGLKTVKLYTKSKKPVASRETYEKGSLKIGNTTYDLKVKGRGNSSWGQMPKHSYTLKLDKKAKLLGMAEDKSWVLVSNYGDKTLIRNQYIEYLGTQVFNRMKWNPHFEQVELYINDEYQGTYLLGEKIKLAEKRIKVPEGGFLIEINRREDEEFNFRTKRDVSISLKEPDKADKNEQARIKKIIQDAEDALFSKDYMDPKKGYAAYFDVDSLVDYYLINEYSKNVDSAWFSSIYFVYDPKDGKLHFGPLWDYDLGFGNINYNDCDNPEGYYIQKRSVWYSRLVTDPAFCQRVKKRWNEKKSTVYKSIETEIDKLSVRVRESSYYNFEKWPILGEYVWPNADGYESRLSIESEIKYLKDWCYKRFEWLDKELNKY